MRFLFVDRVLYSSPGEFIQGVKHITKDDFYLAKAEGGRPCFIPSLIGETLGQMAAWNVMQHNQFTARPVAGVVSQAQLHRPAYVGETLFLEAWIDALDEQAVEYHGVASVGNEPVFTVDGALGPLLAMDVFIEQDEVRQQFAEINRPGVWEETVNPSTTVPLFIPASLTTLPELSFDCILLHEPGVSLVAEKRISRAAPYYADHFPKKPVLPMTVLLECKLNLAHWFVKQAGYNIEYQVSQLRKIKMNEFVQPGDVVVCSLKVKSQTIEELVLSYRSEVNGKRVCVVDVVFFPRGK